MNSEFYIGGKKYISAKRASKLTGYASDYIGQLARAGKLDGQIIGRSWYVAEDSLLGYKQTVISDAFSNSKGRENQDKSRKTSQAKTQTKTRGERAGISPAKTVPLVSEMSEAAEPKTAQRSRIRVPGEVRMLALAKPGRPGARSRRRSGSRLPALPSVKALIETPARAIAAPLSHEVVIASSKLPERHVVDALRAAGTLFMSSAIAFALLLVVASSGALYKNGTAGAGAVGESLASAGMRAAEISDRGRTYLAAGAAVAVSMAENVSGPDVQSSRDEETEPSFIARLIHGAASRFNASAIAFYETVNGIFGETPSIEVRLSKLATNAETHDPEAEEKTPAADKGMTGGLVVVPSTGDEALDEEIERHIKNSFSDEVVIERDGDQTGVIKPVFKSGKEDEYLYVLVPIGEGG